MNAVTAVTQTAHLDWHTAGMPPRFKRAYSHQAFHFLVMITDEDGPWETSVFWVNRDGDDPNTDEANFDEPLYDCVLEQTSECTPHPRQAEINSPENGSENGPANELDHRSNLEMLDQAIQQVTYAVIDVGTYDDESETLTYHTQQLKSAQQAITQVRENLHAKA